MQLDGSFFGGKFSQHTLDTPPKCALHTLIHTCIFHPFREISPPHSHDPAVYTRITPQPSTSHSTASPAYTGPVGQSGEFRKAAQEAVSRDSIFRTTKFLCAKQIVAISHLTGMAFQQIPTH